MVSLKLGDSQLQWHLIVLTSASKSSGSILPFCHFNFHTFVHSVANC